jgi:transcriptional regulator with XRE-family HTH domain
MNNLKPGTAGWQLLAALRQNAKLTQRGLAGAAGISRSMIAQLEMGSRRPSRSLLQKLCRAVDASVLDEARLMLAYGFLPSSGTLVWIEAVLLNDDRLSAGQASHIFDVVQEAYEHFVG